MPLVTSRIWRLLAQGRGCAPSDPVASLRAVFKWIVAGVLVLAVLGAVGYYLYSEENEPIEKRGSATEEFVTTEEEEPKPPPKKENPRPWPTYSYDDQRRHISPYDHRPPYRRLWTIDAHDTLEFPPTVGYGKVYLAQQKGLFFALDAQTGRVHWRKSLGPLRGVLAHDREERRLRLLHAPGRVPAGAGRRRRVRGGLGRRDRPRTVEVQVGADRVLAAAEGQAPVRRVMGPRCLRAQRGERQADLALRGGQRGQHLGRLLAGGGSSSPRTAARSTR